MAVKERKGKERRVQYLYTSTSNTRINNTYFYTRHSPSLPPVRQQRKKKEKVCIKVYTYLTRSKGCVFVSTLHDVKIGFRILVVPEQSSPSPE